MDRKCFARMERLLILTLLISGYSEEQRVKWEVNKQIRRLKSKIAICFEKRFDGIDEEGRWFEKLWVFLCEFQARDGLPCSRQPRTLQPTNLSKLV